MPSPLQELIDIAKRSRRVEVMNWHAGDTGDIDTVVLRVDAEYWVIDEGGSRLRQFVDDAGTIRPR